MKARVCQHFEVFQNEFANFCLPCEGRLRRAVSGECEKFSGIGEWTKTPGN